MRSRPMTGRKATDVTIKITSVFAAMIGIFALFWILFETAARGIGAINWSFFTMLPPTPASDVPGGLANAIIGTFVITGLASLMAVPIGLLAGIFLSEFGHEGRLAYAIRYVNNSLMGTPSIIVGLFVFSLIVIPMGSFSGFAGAVALAILMLPVITRTTEDILKLVPNELRESALAIGTPRWKTTLGIVFRAAKAGLATGTILAVARVSGETAPLLFTALNNKFWMRSLFEPTPNLTVTIFNYAMSPYDNWQQLAWGGALLTMTIVLAFNIVARLIIRERKPGRV